ncbi:hypothetical protein I4U23_013411 [Adineta vaga]|nr:hypothetical protein I4U23_013411 [Adineta vaga]
MSNLRSTGHMPLKTSMTNKWKSQAPTSELLERQTRALEDSLNKLKLAMHPDKTKATTETNGPIWDKGKSGPLSQYANHVLRDDPRRPFDANKPTKIRVLTDEPPAPVNRPSVVANLFSTKSNTSNKSLRCGQCEKDEAKMKCLECAESYCTTCFAHFHLRGALQRHRCIPLSESRPSTPQKKKTTVGADVIFKELRVAQSKDDFLRKSTMGTEVYDYNDEADDIDYEDINEENGGQLLNGNYDEKTSAASFQQALMQWRQQDNGNKKSKKTNQSKKKKSTHEAAVDTVYDTNGEINSKAVPNIEFHSSKLTYAEKLLVKKYRRSNRNNQEFFNQRTNKPKLTPRDKSKKPEQIQVDYSLPEIINLNNANIEIEPMYDELSTMRTDESARTITTENTRNNHYFEQDGDDEEEELVRLKQERPKSRTSTKPISRPNSSAMRKNSTASRPSSVALYQHPLPSLLTTNPSDEFKSVVDGQSRPSSAALKKPTKLDYRLPSLWNRNWKPEQSMSDGVNMNLIKIDQEAVTQFDLALDDLLDETKIENASRSDNPPPTSRPSTAKQAASPLPPPPPPLPPLPLPSAPLPSPSSISARSGKEKIVDSATPTPRQSSLFNLSNSPRKVDSSSSIDAGDGGFFTDVHPPRKVVKSPAPPSIIERSLANELKHSFTNRSVRSSAEHRPVIPNLMSLRKTSIETLSPPPPKRSITLEETHNQFDDLSRPGSSVSSASLPVSIISSKADLITRPLVERYPKANNPQPAPQTTKKFRVEFPKKSAPPIVPPMIIEGKKVTSASASARDNDDHLQQSMNSTRSKISAGAQRSQNIAKISTTSSMTSVTRDENALKDESLTITDTLPNKSINRRSTNIERKPTKSRTMEFTVRDGAKWQNGSLDSVPSKSISSPGPRQSLRGSMARPSTPSNPTNSKLANQFIAYDIDDGRSSRACQDINDEESFNQLREELCSELGMNSPGWDASLSEHVLKNLPETKSHLYEKKLHDNLTMLEVQLRESESFQRTQRDDDDSTVHEEIRNL